MVKINKKNQSACSERDLEAVQAMNNITRSIKIFYINTAKKKGVESKFDLQLIDQ